MSKCWRPRQLELLNNIQNKVSFFESAELVALGRKIKMDWPELRSKAEALASSPSPPGNNKQIHVNHQNKQNPGKHQMVQPLYKW